MQVRSCPGRLEEWLKRSKILVNRPENKQTIEATIKALKENRKDNWEQELVHLKDILRC